MQTLAESPLGRAVKAAAQKGLRILSRKLFGNRLLLKVHQEEQQNDGLLSSSSYECYIVKAKEEDNPEAKAYCEKQCAIAKRREAEQRRQEELRRQREEEERQRIAALQKKKEDRKKLLRTLVFSPVLLPFAVVRFVLVITWKLLRRCVKGLIRILIGIARAVGFAFCFIIACRKVIFRFLFCAITGCCLGTALAFLIFNWHELLHQPAWCFQQAMKQIGDSLEYIDYTNLSYYRNGAVSAGVFLCIWFLFKRHKYKILRTAKRTCISALLVFFAVQIYIHYHELPQICHTVHAELLQRRDSFLHLFGNCPDCCIMKRALLKISAVR